MSPDILDAELVFNRYNVFRTDRSNKTSNCKRGGGVAILVDKRFDSVVIKLPTDNVEQIFVLLKWGNNFKCIIGACYIPPLSPASCYSAHTETVEWLLNKFSLEINLTIYGDYNLPHVRFTSNYVGLVK